MEDFSPRNNSSEPDADFFLYSLKKDSVKWNELHI